MSTAIGNRKIRAFALFGAVGCLVAGLVGEGLLASTPQTGESLSAPTTPELPPDVEQPPTPSPPARIPPPAATKAGDPVLAARLKEAGAGTGDVQISLRWDNRNDLDLHCIDPTKYEICYKKKKSPSGGWLDVDRNVKGETTTPVENIFWKTGAAPLGRYQVFVVHFATKAGASDPTEFLVEIKVDGVLIERYRSKISRGDKDEEPKSKVLTFDVKPVLDLGVPQEAVVVNQGGKNRFGVLIERKRFKGAVSIPAQKITGLTLTEAVVPADGKEATIEIAATDDAAPGEKTIDVVARSGSTETKTPLKIKVQRVPPTLRVKAPTTVEVNQGGDNRFTLLVGRGHFKGPINILFEGDKEGLTLEEQTVPAGTDRIDVTLSALKKTPAGDRQITIKAAGADVFATTALQVRINQVGKTAPAWSWSEILRQGGWTGLLALGLALALVCGQNHYLNRPLINAGVIVIALGSLAAGAIAGGLGQALYAGLLQADLMPMIGRTVAWLLLGGALGRGVGFFIPNLDGWKASIAGAVGGLLAGLVFLTPLGGVPVRLLGAALLGMAIGLMVAWAEQTFRKFWLEVRYGTHEQRTVNLGPEPIKVGSDSRSCAVYIRGAAPVALRYWLSQGRIQCEDVPTKQTTEALPDQPLQLGNTTLTLRTAEVAASSASKPQAPVAPPPPPSPPQPELRLPEQAPQPARPVVANACPKCGRVVDGPIGRRYCIVDDLTF